MGTSIKGILTKTISQRNLQTQLRIVSLTNNKTKILTK